MILYLLAAARYYYGPSGAQSPHFAEPTTKPAAIPPKASAGDLKSRATNAVHAISNQSAIPLLPIALCSTCANALLLIRFKQLKENLHRMAYTNFNERG